MVFIPPRGIDHNVVCAVVFRVRKPLAAVVKLGEILVINRVIHRAVGILRGFKHDAFIHANDREFIGNFFNFKMPAARF